MKFSRLALFTMLLVCAVASLSEASDQKIWGPQRVYASKFNGSGAWANVSDTSTVKQTTTDTLFVDLMQRARLAGLMSGSTAQVAARLWIEKVASNGVDSVYYLLSPGLAPIHRGKAFQNTLLSVNPSVSGWTSDSLLSIPLTVTPNAVSGINLWAAPVCRVLLRGPVTGGALQYRAWVTFYQKGDDD